MADQTTSRNIQPDSSGVLSAVSSKHKQYTNTNNTNNNLIINNIDEINLNLDELDDELGEELDLNTLTNTKNTKNTKNGSGDELNKDANTKYIFFKDVA